MPCGTGSRAKPTSWDCLGAILWAYREFDTDERHFHAKHAFDLCKARYGHKMLSKLHWEEAIALLIDAGV